LGYGPPVYIYVYIPILSRTLWQIQSHKSTSSLFPFPLAFPHLFLSMCRLLFRFPLKKNLQLLFLHLCTQLFPAFHPFLAFFHCKIRSLGEKNGRVLHINLHFFQRKFAILICLIYCEKSQTNPVFRTLYKNTTFHQFSLYFLVIFLSFLLRLIP